MLLAINVNNTHTLLGLYDGEKLLVHWRIRTDHARTIDEYGVLLRGLFAEWDTPRPAISGVALSSVVPQLNDRMEEVARRFFGHPPLVVGPGVRTGISILYDNPKEVGADRICNSVAAFDRLHGPAIVVDLGTATTFDVVSARGEYVGGVIVPGIGISLDALIGRTAKLPRVELVWPPRVIGKTTVQAIQAGVTFGYTALIDGLVARIREENDPAARVLATGGLANLIASHSTTIESVDEFLTLDGLRIIYTRNGGRDGH